MSSKPSLDEIKEKLNSIVLNPSLSPKEKEKEIDRTYRAASRKHHPDKGKTPDRPE